MHKEVVWNPTSLIYNNWIMKTESILSLTVHWQLKGETSYYIGKETAQQDFQLKIQMKMGTKLGMQSL